MTRRDSCGKAGTHAGITEHSIAREPMCGECAEFHATYRGARGVRPTVLRVETEERIRRRAVELLIRRHRQEFDYLLLQARRSEVGRGERAS